MIYVEIADYGISFYGCSAHDFAEMLDEVFGEKRTWGWSGETVNLSRSQSLKLLAHYKFTPVSRNFFYKDA